MKISKKIGVVFGTSVILLILVLFIFAQEGYFAPLTMIPIDSDGGSATFLDWLANPYFTSPTLLYDSGVRKNTITNMAPSGWKWGVRGYTWSTTSGLMAIEEFGFKSYQAGTNDWNVQLYAKDASGRWGVATLIQGWVWGGSPPASWNRPSPISATAYSTLKLEAWVWHQGGCYPWWKFYDWNKNCLFDVWMKDANGKILMIDIYFSGYGTDWKESNIYHMAYTAASVPQNSWTYIVVDLKPLINTGIDRAISAGVNIDRNSLKIYQAEILLEVRNAWGNLDVGMFRLVCG